MELGTERIRQFLGGLGGSGRQNKNSLWLDASAIITNKTQWEYRWEVGSKSG